MAKSKKPAPKKPKKPKKRKAKPPKSGKPFEEIVKLIQLALADHPSTTVQSNAKIKDLDGAIVEVDVLVDTVVSENLPVRIVFECKDHNRTIEKQHIESFNSKCERLPANKRVYVSSKGFQSGARLKAKQFNIELLVLQDVSDDTTNSARIRSLVPLLNVHREIVGARVLCPDLPDEASRAIQSLVCRDRKTVISTRDAARLLMMSDPPTADSIEPGTTSATSKRFVVDPGEYFVNHEGRLYEVPAIEVTVRIVKGEPIVEPKRLATEDGQAVHADFARYRMPIGGGMGSVGVTVSEKTGEPTFLLQSPKQIPKGDCHYYMRYRLADSLEIREACQQFSSPSEQSEFGRIRIDLKFLPKDAQILEAKLRFGKWSPIEWTIHNLHVEHSGPSEIKEADLDKACICVGTDPKPYSLRTILRNSFLANPPKYDDMQMGVFRNAQVTVNTIKSPAFIKGEDETLYPITKMYCTVRYERANWATDQNA